VVACVLAGLLREWSASRALEGRKVSNPVSACAVAAIAASRIPSVTELRFMVSASTADVPKSIPPARSRTANLTFL